MRGERPKQLRCGFPATAALPQHSSQPLPNFQRDTGQSQALRRPLQSFGVTAAQKKRARQRSPPSSRSCLPRTYLSSFSMMRSTGSLMTAPPSASSLMVQSASVSISTRRQRTQWRSQSFGLPLLPRRQPAMTGLAGEGQRPLLPLARRTIARSSSVLPLSGWLLTAIINHATAIIDCLMDSNERLRP